MSKKMYVGRFENKPEDYTKNQGHEYGKGRATRIHKHKNEKRGKSKLKNELRRYY